MSLLRKLLLLAGALMVSLLLTVLWMAGGVQGPRTFTADVEQLDAVVDDGRVADASTLRVLVWNAAWGYGFGADGSGAAKPATHFAESVRRMGEVVRRSGADVVLLQEVDFDATRSHRVDQAEAIARAAGLPYVARAVSWKANWVPFPYWPPSEHFGRMRSGGAVLSRFPLTAHDVELLPKPDSNPFYYNLFYLFRYAQQVRIDTPFGELFATNVHLEAFDADNRLAQARAIAERLRTQVTPLTILAGDFNALPPEATVKTGFADEPDTDFRGDDTVQLLRQIDGLSDAFAATWGSAGGGGVSAGTGAGATADAAVTAAAAAASDIASNAEGAFYTFPAFAPNRKLDHALIGSGFTVREARVYREAGDVSDHLPLLITLEIAGD